MPESIVWTDLLEIYRAAVWLDGDNANITITNEHMLSTLKLVDSSDKAQADANIIVENPEGMEIGKTIHARVSLPRLSLGVLAATWDDLLASPKARIKEPTAYFIKEDGADSSMTPASDRTIRYRALLDFVRMLERCALFLDVSHQTLVYFREKKIEVPVEFAASDLRLLDPEDLASLHAALQGDIHQEQRLEIFADAITTLAAAQPTKGRFVYLAQNAGELARRVSDGYKLFASSFSYAKIQSEVEAAHSEYVGRIHKTFVDIQGQLLGLPVAALVVATQLKVAKTCSIEAWANLAVLVGAWLFALLLVLSCINQWITLKAIRTDIGRQKLKLIRDFSEISTLFTKTFTDLDWRIGWHRFILIVVGVIAIGAAIFATLIFRATTIVSISSCLWTTLSGE